uniref:SAC3/GANP/THP3 conserved domain-containing protein n=1 Tax=Picocystis salinarum TaxID=88271 RepID=A0A7S3XDA6_9CHLO
MDRTQNPMQLNPTGAAQQTDEPLDSPAVLEARAARFKKTLQRDTNHTSARVGTPASTTVWPEKPLLKDEDASFEMEEGRQLCLTEEQETDPQRGPIVGTCEDMCPRSERERRERLDDIHFFERVEAGDRSRTSKELAVKRFSRQIDNPPPSDVRTRKALQRTMVHLRRLLLWADMDGADANTRVSRLATVHKFLWDRYRGVRSDLTVQGIRDGFAIQLLEEMVRFHIMAEHELCEAAEAQIDDHEGFNRHLNVEQLNKCLITLNEFYTDAWARSKCRQGYNASWTTGKDVPQECRNEPEFRSYHLLTQLGTHGKYKQNMSQVVRDLSSLPPYCLRTPPIELALCMLSLMGTGNFVGFFQNVGKKEMPYLAACCAFMVSSSVRSKALKVIYNTGCRGEHFPIQRLQELLLFDNFDQAVALCKHHGLVPASCSGEVQSFTMNKDTFIEPSRSFPAFLSSVVREKRAKIPLADVIKNPAWKYLSTSLQHDVTPSTPSRLQPSQAAAGDQKMSAPATRFRSKETASVSPQAMIQTKNKKREQDQIEALTTEPPQKRRRDGVQTPTEVDLAQVPKLTAPFQVQLNNVKMENKFFNEAKNRRVLEEERKVAEKNAQAQARAEWEREMRVKKEREAAERERERVRRVQAAEAAAQKAKAAAYAEAARAAAAAAEERQRKEARRKEKCRKSVLKFRVHQWRKVACRIINAKLAAARHKASVQACSADPSMATGKFQKIFRGHSNTTRFKKEEALTGPESEQPSDFDWSPLQIGHIVVPHLHRKGMCSVQGAATWKVLVSCPIQETLFETGVEKDSKIDRHVCDWLWCKLGGYPHRFEEFQKEFNGLNYSCHIHLSKLLGKADWPMDRKQEAGGLQAFDQKSPINTYLSLPNDEVHPRSVFDTVDFQVTAVDVGSSSCINGMHFGCCGGIFLMSSAAARGGKMSISNDCARMAEMVNLLERTSQHLPILVVLPPGAGGADELRLWRRRMHTAIHVALGLDNLPNTPVNIVALPPGIISSVWSQKLERGVDWLALQMPVPPRWSVVHPYDYVVLELDSVTCGAPEEYVEAVKSSIARLLEEVKSPEVLALEQWGLPPDPEVHFFPDENVEETRHLSLRIVERRRKITSILQKVLAGEVAGTSQNISANFSGTSGQWHYRAVQRDTPSASGFKDAGQDSVQQRVYELLVPLANAPYVLLAQSNASYVNKMTVQKDEFVPQSPAYIKEQYEQSAGIGSLLSIALAKSVEGGARSRTLSGAMPKNLEKHFLGQVGQAHGITTTAAGVSEIYNSVQDHKRKRKSVEQLQSALKSEIQKEREFEDMLVCLAASTPEF